MNEQLQRAYDALQQADAAGNAEDAQQLADYIRELEAQVMVQEEKKPAPSKGDGLESPVTYGLGGALVGRLAGPAIGAGVDTAVRGMMGQRAQAAKPPAQPQMPKVEPSMSAPTATPKVAPPHPVGSWTKSQYLEYDKEGNPKGIGFGGRSYAEAAERQKTVANAEKATKGAYRGLAGSGLIVESKLADEINQPRLAEGTPPTRSAAQLSAPPLATPPSAPPKPSFMGRLTRGMAPPTKAPMYIGGAMAAGQGRDAYEQMREGNVGEAALSGAGALGGLGMFSRIKPVRAAGTLLGVGTPLARMYRSLTKDEDEPERKAMGGLAGYAKGKRVKQAYEYGAEQAGKLSDWAQNYIDQYITPIQSDRMAGVGGPSFSANQIGRPEYKGRVWGQGKPSAASSVANLAKDPRFGGPSGQVFVPMVGSERMHQSNQIMWDRLLEEFYKNPQKLTPDLRKAINEYIQSGGLVSGKSKSSFDPIENFDIADREMVEGLGKTFDARKTIAQHAFGGEGIGGRKAQIIPYEKMLAEYTDPNVLGAETFSVGPRAFRLTGQTEKTPRPDLNEAFPYLLHGEDLGVTYSLVPSELSLMDFQRNWRRDTGKTLPLKSGKLPQPGYYEHTMGYKPPGSSERVYPRQKITEDWIKELQRSEFKRGGLSQAPGESSSDQDLLSAYEFERRKEGRPSNYNRGTLSRGNSRADIDIASDNGGNVYQNYYRYSDPEAAQRDYENLLAESEMRNDLSGYAEGGKTPAWQRAEGKNPEGGLNAKGRASYKAETGGTLKRPQPEGGARRDSFCARMTGMKKKLTSSKTANDPDSRINKSLRKWNC